MSQVIDVVELRNSINYLLPSNGGISMYTSKAMDISEKYLSKVKRRFHEEDSIHTHSLRVALRVAKRCKELCQNEAFFDFRPIIIALLHDVIEDADCPELREELKFFRSDDEYIIKGIEALTNSEQGIKEHGRSKYMIIKFSNLLKTDKELFFIKLADRMDNLAGLASIEETKEFVTNPRESKLWKRSYLMESFMIYLNILNSKAVIHESVYETFNEFIKILNKNKF